MGLGSRSQATPFSGLERSNRAVWKGRGKDVLGNELRLKTNGKFWLLRAAKRSRHPKSFGETSPFPASRRSRGIGRPSGRKETTATSLEALVFIFIAAMKDWLPPRHKNFSNPTAPPRHHAWKRTCASSRRRSFTTRCAAKRKLPDENCVGICLSQRRSASALTRRACGACCPRLGPIWVVETHCGQAYCRKPARFPGIEAAIYFAATAPLPFLEADRRPRIVPLSIRR